MTKVFFCVQVKQLSISFERVSFNSVSSQISRVKFELNGTHEAPMRASVCSLSGKLKSLQNSFWTCRGSPWPVRIVYRPQKPTLYDQHSYLTVQNCSSCIIFQIRISNSPLQIFSFNQSNSWLPVDTSLISTNRCSFCVLVTFWVLWRTEKVF